LLIPDEPVNDRFVLLLVDNLLDGIAARPSGQCDQPAGTTP
jgi:hypothetical protein